jgi:drug/metabolite transporter (DMT)-like permease
MERRTLLGVCVSLVGHSTSALGLNLQRYAHVMKSDQPLVRRLPWLIGMACIALCEVINFVAMSLAPVSIITPLGAFSVIASAVFGNLLFSEPVTRTGILGIACITIGTILIVTNGPSSSRDFTVEQFKDLIARPYVIAYICGIAAVMVFLGIFGRNNLFGILGLASLGAANSIVISKALSTFVKVSIFEANQLSKLLPYILAVVLVLSLVLQVRMVNRALENHKCYIVNSLYFVMLTLMTVINATIVYGEMIAVAGVAAVLFTAGAAGVVVGVYLLAVTKDDAASDEERRSLARNKLPALSV